MNDFAGNYIYIEIAGLTYLFLSWKMKQIRYLTQAMNMNIMYGWIIISYPSCRHHLSSSFSSSRIYLPQTLPKIYGILVGYQKCHGWSFWDCCGQSLYANDVGLVQCLIQLLQFQCSPVLTGCGQAWRSKLLNCWIRLQFERAPVPTHFPWSPLLSENYEQLIHTLPSHKTLRQVHKRAESGRGSWKGDAMYLRTCGIRKKLEMHALIYLLPSTNFRVSTKRRVQPLNQTILLISSKR